MVDRRSNTMTNFESVCELVGITNDAFQSPFLSIDSKINILNEIKSNIAKIECYKDGANDCIFSRVFDSEYDEKYKEMRKNIICVNRADTFEISINDSDVTRKKYSDEDCIINFLESHINILIDSLVEQKNAARKNTKVVVKRQKRNFN